MKKIKVRGGMVWCLGGSQKSRGALCSPGGVCRIRETFPKH